MTQGASRQKRRRDPFAVRMGLACFVGLGGFILWAGFVPLEEGVTAHGAVVVENNRQVVQHLEGGIIRSLDVREGDIVAKGEVLMTLQETASLASRDQVSQEIAALRASVIRLTALQDEAVALDLSFLDEIDIGAIERGDIIDREMNLFDQQREAVAADLAVLESRRRGTLASQAQRGDQVEIAERSLEAAREELDVISGMFARQLARRDQVTSLERTVSTLEGDIARLAGERDALGAEARDLASQMDQTRARFRQDISSQLLAARTELLAAEERLSAAQDILDRAVITAPVSGEVLNLNFATEGGVVRPGEAILEIVPDVDSVIASIRIRPNDRASVFEGQSVRTQVSAYRSWRSPSLDGEIIDVSADLKTDPASGVVYYEARIRVPQTALDKAPELEIIPGMPVDAFIYSGRSRTTLDYLFEPLNASLFRGLRAS